jgi:hypothetical protein
MSVSIRERAKAEKAKIIEGIKAQNHGIDSLAAEAIMQEHSGFPNFRLTYQDKDKNRYGGYIVGVNPRFGKSDVAVNSVLVPTKTTFHPYGEDPVTYDSMEAIDNIKMSPIFHSAQFPNGRGQYLTQLMKANFPDAHKDWNLRLHHPRIDEQIDLDVPYSDGDVYTYDKDIKFGIVKNEGPMYELMINYLESQVQQKKAAAGTLFIFVTKNANTMTAAGYHSYYQAKNGQVYYFMWTSWYDPKIYGEEYFFPDTFTLSHEVAEWAFDYNLVNDSPNWKCPSYKGSNDYGYCVGDLYGFENGDVLNCGNGAVPARKRYVTTNGYPYPIQTVALWQWFTGDPSITGHNGAYSFPDPTFLTSPAEFCDPGRR